MSDLYIVGLRFDEAMPTYCYYSSSFKEGEKAVAEIDGNSYLGVVSSCRPIREGEDLSLYWPLTRPADDSDLKGFEENAKRDLSLIQEVQKEADKEGLQMKVFRVYSSLDRQKTKIMYTADERVDFRNLIKVLAPYIGARIEMRQVGPRDKAKMVGGLGICGLPLCCSTFLDNFGVISISMAKNQMLAINIPKLSGQCGKLICCLKYEDEAYAQAKKEFPKVGTSISYQGSIMKVISMNLLARVITLESPDNTVTISLDEYNAVSQGKTYVPPVQKTVSEIPAPSELGIENPISESAAGQAPIAANNGVVAPKPVPSSNPQPNRSGDNRYNGQRNNGNGNNWHGGNQNNRNGNSRNWHQQNNNSHQNGSYHGQYHGNNGQHQGGNNQHYNGNVNKNSGNGNGNH
jgi:cell fate regulator YaaT (PSP1 superfamily)